MGSFTLYGDGGEEEGLREKAIIFVFVSVKTLLFIRSSSVFAGDDNFLFIKAPSDSSLAWLVLSGQTWVKKLLNSTIGKKAFDHSKKKSLLRFRNDSFLWSC